MTTLIQCFDTNTLIALAAEPGGATVTANLFQMMSLAVKDPEGCVRFNPHSVLDAESFSRAFNCSADLVRNSIETLCKYGILIAEDGKLFIERLRSLKQKETAAAEQEEKLRAEREKTRQRVAKSRALKKENEYTVANSVTEPAEKSKADSVTGSVTETEVEKIYEARTENSAKIFAENNVTDHVTTNVTPFVTGNVTGYVTPVVTAPKNMAQTRMDTACSEVDADLCNANCNGGDKHINIYNKYALYANKPISLYAAREKKKENGGKLVLREKLPASCRNILDAWNKLPFKKFKGLIPSMQQKLEHLLQYYGENTVCQTIENIAKSEFLLGKKGGGWFLTLGWLLQPENFSKVLSGKYQDTDEPRNNASWLTGEPCPFFLPGEREDGAPMTAEETEKALDALLHPRNALLDESARLLALPLQEVPA